MADRTLAQLEALRAANEAAAHDARRRILAAVIELVQDKTWESITVTDIVRVSGVSRSAFYRHYKSKQEVIDQSMAEIGRRIVSVDHADSVELWRHIFEEVAALRPAADTLVASNAFARVLKFLNTLVTPEMTREEKVGQLIWNGACYNLISYYLTTPQAAPPALMAQLAAQLLAGQAGEMSPLLKEKSTRWLHELNQVAPPA